VSISEKGKSSIDTLLMFHYKRLYSYTSDENIFFAVTFSLSFFLGSPCVLTGIFG
jgi:hypothetical protein